MKQKLALTSSEEPSRNKLRLFLALAGFIFFALLCFGCARTTPIVERPTVISFDGNDQNAGFIRWLPDHSIEITPSKLDQYNDLVKRYGTSPRITRTEKNFGVVALPNGNFSMTKEAVQRFGRLLDIAERERIDNAR